MFQEKDGVCFFFFSIVLQYGFVKVEGHQTAVAMRRNI